MTSYRFPSDHRIRHQRDFEQVHRGGTTASDEVLVVRAARTDLPHPRLGLAVSRLVGPAVVRNRWKRLIREAFRLKFTSLPSGFDLVVRPRKGAQPDFVAICDSLPRLAARLARQSARGRR